MGAYGSYIGFRFVINGSLFNERLKCCFSAFFSHFFLSTAAVLSFTVFFICLLTFFHCLILQEVIFRTATFLILSLYISYNYVALCNSHYLNKPFVPAMTHNYASTISKNGQKM